MDLLLEQKATVGMVSFSQNLENVAKVLAHPAIMIGSDSIGLSEGAGAAHGQAASPDVRDVPPRAGGVRARARRSSRWRQPCNKMTGMPARRLGLKDRGLLRPGYAADVTVFDPATVRDESTYADPHRYPAGIPT